MNHTIATIGYEGSTIDDFVVALLHVSIDVLIDVRDLPLSRKKGFSKNQLAGALAAAGIEYVHLRGLGDPRAGRQAARAGNYREFQTIFNRHMKTEAALRDIDIAPASCASNAITRDVIAASLPTGSRRLRS